MQDLRSHLNFTQLRFHCSKKQGRTFHVATVANSSGEAVVQYFSGQTNVVPNSCGSFQKMRGDNSELAAQCERWGHENRYYVGKWGKKNQKREERLYDRAALQRSTTGIWEKTTGSVMTRLMIPSRRQEIFGKSTCVKGLKRTRGRAILIWALKQYRSALFVTLLETVRYVNYSYLSWLIFISNFVYPYIAKLTCMRHVFYRPIYGTILTCLQRDILCVFPRNKPRVVSGS